MKGEEGEQRGLDCTWLANTEFMSFMDGWVIFKRRLHTAAASALCKHKTASL